MTKPFDFRLTIALLFLTAVALAMAAFPTP